jgi:hypothetical protein
MYRTPLVTAALCAALIFATVDAGADPQSSSKSKPDMRSMMTGKADSNYKSKQAVHYKDCAAVRRAGKAPLKRGDPGYGRHLDPDGDGVACQ